MFRTERHSGGLAGGSGAVAPPAKRFEGALEKRKGALKQTKSNMQMKNN